MLLGRRTAWLPRVPAWAFVLHGPPFAEKPPRMLRVLPAAGNQVLRRRLGLVLRLTAAARIRAGAAAQQRDAAAASASVVLRAQSVIRRASGVIRARDASCAARAAAALASARAVCAAAACLSAPVPPPAAPVHSACRAQVLATVLRGRPQCAEVVGPPTTARRGCVRERAEALRGADGRRLAKAVRCVERAVTVTAVTAVPRSGDGKHGCHAGIL